MNVNIYLVFCLLMSTMNEIWIWMHFPTLHAIFSTHIRIRLQSAFFKSWQYSMNGTSQTWWEPFKMFQIRCQSEQHMLKFLTKFEWTNWLKQIHVSLQNDHCTCRICCECISLHSTPHYSQIKEKQTNNINYYVSVNTLAKYTL